MPLCWPGTCSKGLVTCPQESLAPAPGPQLSQSCPLHVGRQGSHSMSPRPWDSWECGRVHSEHPYKEPLQACCFHTGQLGNTTQPCSFGPASSLNWSPCKVHWETPTLCLPLMPEVDLLGFLSPCEVIVVQWSLVLSTLALWKPVGHSLVFISSNSLWRLGLRSAWPTVPGELEQGAGKSNGQGAILPHLVFCRTCVCLDISLWNQLVTLPL